MTTVNKIFPVIVLSVVLCGCFDGQIGQSGGSNTSGKSDVRIIGLTEIAQGADGSEFVDAYVDIDGFMGGRISDDTTFRFELYEHVARSARHIGARIHIWPDIVINDLDEDHWKSHLKAYNFRLPIDFALAGQGIFVLQVTVIAGANGSDSDLFVLKK